MPEAGENRMAERVEERADSGWVDEVSSKRTIQQSIFYVDKAT